MSATTGGGSYRAVLSLPRAAPTFAAALVGRLAYGLLPLSLLLTVADGTGSFAVAGAVLAVFGLTSLTLPRKARLVDRHGQRRVLPVLALVTSTALAALAVLTLTGTATATRCLLVGVVEGLAAPPLGPAMRATWSRLSKGTTLKPAAYSLDSVCEESLYLIGPVLVGVVLTVAPAAVALLITAALLSLGTVAMVVIGPDGATLPIGPTRRLGPLAEPGVLGLVVTVGIVATGLAMAYTGVAARARAEGHAEAAGWVEAALAAGSVVGGLAWGRRVHNRRRATHLAALVAILAIGVGLAGLAPSLVLVGAAMALAGTAVAPLFVVAYVGVDDLAPEGQQTEASTWVNTGNNVGSAVGSAVAGLLVDRVAIGAVFAVGAVLLALVATRAGVPRRPTPGRRRRRGRPAPGSTRPSPR